MRLNQPRIPSTEGFDGTKVPAFPGACGEKVLLEAKEMTTDIHTGPPARIRLPRRLRPTRRLVGGFYLSMDGVHLGIVAANPSLRILRAKRSFRVHEIRMEPDLHGSPSHLGIGPCGRRNHDWPVPADWRQVCPLRWGAVIAFHLALMLFGWGIWTWSVPALEFLIPAA